MENRPERNEEIDLSYFFRPLTRLMKRTGDGLGAYTRLLYRRRFIFLFIFLAITAVGFSLRYFLPRAYQTEGIYVSHLVPNKYCSMMVENLDKLIGQSNNNDIVADQLKIKPEYVNDIVKLQLIPLKDTFVIEKKDTALSLFRVNLVVKNMQYVDSIQKGLLNYLENSDYARKRKAARYQNLLALKAELGRKMISLDSVKKIVNNSIIPRNEGRGLVYGEPINPVQIYEAEQRYYEMELDINESLATIENIEVIQPFLKSNNYNYPNFNTYLISFAIAGLITALILTPAIGRR